MELNSWIENVGGAAPAGRVGRARIRLVAGLLGEKPRTVSSWYRKERIPGFAAAMNIMVKTRGLVDWNGIYAPFARKLIDGGEEHAGA